MKPKGRHPHNALTAAKVRNAPPGRHADGGGLYLQVDPSGARRWLLRITVRGKRTDMGLGSAIDLPLADAREEARRLRLIARAGEDPLADRRKQREVPTFQEAAEQAHRERVASWDNKKHAAQWISTLKTYAFPLFGRRRVDQVTTTDVHNALLPIWHTKQETARRLRQRIATVLDWAAAHGHRQGENPANLVRQSLGNQSSNKPRGHHAAMPYDDVPTFVASLESAPITETVRLALEFTILTAARTSEVINARFDEIEGSIWTIPAARMKARKEHRVPLSSRCTQIVERCRELRSDEFLFPGQRGGHLSNQAMLMTMRRNAPDYTVHGFRSSFRDWAAEQTAFPREVCEAALAHTLESKVEAAYRRSDLFAKRQKLMDVWTAFVTTPTNSEKVLPFKAR